MACSFQKRGISSSSLGKLCLLSTGLNMVHLRPSDLTHLCPATPDSFAKDVAPGAGGSALGMTDRLFQVGEALSALYGFEHGSPPAKRPDPPLPGHPRFLRGVVLSLIC